MRGVDTKSAVGHSAMWWHGHRTYFGGQFLKHLKTSCIILSLLCTSFIFIKGLLHRLHAKDWGFLFDWVFIFKLTERSSCILILYSDIGDEAIITWADDSVSVSLCLVIRSLDTALVWQAQDHSDDEWPQSCNCCHLNTDLIGHHTPSLGFEVLCSARTMIWTLEGEENCQVSVAFRYRFCFHNFLFYF